MKFGDVIKNDGSAQLFNQSRSKYVVNYISKYGRLVQKYLQLDGGHFGDIVILRRKAVKSILQLSSKYSWYC